MSEEIGTSAIILGVLKGAQYDRRRSFYLELGFAEIGNADAGRLFLSIKDAIAVLTHARL